MSLRRAARIDLTQPDIVNAMRRVGAKVIHIKDPFDLLVLFRGRLFMMDPKTPSGRLGKTIHKEQSQVDLEARGWPLLYPRSADEALAMIGARIRGG